MSTKTTPTNDPMELDPQDYLGPKEGLFMPGARREDVRKLVAHVVRDLVAHPPTERNRITGEFIPRAEPVWHRIRHLPIRPNLTVDQFLSGLQGAPLNDLASVVAFLLGAQAREVEAMTKALRLRPIREAFASAHAAAATAAGGAR